MELIFLVFCAVLFGSLATGFYHRQQTEYRQRASAATYCLGGTDAIDSDNVQAIRREQSRATRTQAGFLLRWAEDFIAQSGLSLPLPALLGGHAGLFLCGGLLAAHWLQAGLIPVVGVALALLLVSFLRFCENGDLRLSDISCLTSSICLNQPFNQDTRCSAVSKWLLATVRSLCLASCALSLTRFGSALRCRS